MNDPSSDEEEVSTDAESDQEDPTVAWCPPIPDAAEDPSEAEIASAADKLAILISHVQPSANPFCIPENLGALPPLWLQARLTLSLTAIQEKFARILLSAASELWLRGQLATVEDVLLRVARALTIRLAEKLAQALSSLIRLAESMVTPETECLLYATYWFRPILSELIGSARESSDVNRNRAPSGPVKVLVTDRPHRRLTGVVDLTSAPGMVFQRAGPAKLLRDFLLILLKMHRNHKLRLTLVMSLYLRGSLVVSHLLLHSLLSRPPLALAYACGQVWHSLPLCGSATRV